MFVLAQGAGFEDEKIPLYGQIREDLASHSLSA
jgi:hypothetical protein